MTKKEVDRSSHFLSDEDLWATPTEIKQMTAAEAAAGETYSTEEVNIGNDQQINETQDYAPEENESEEKIKEFVAQTKEYANKDKTDVLYDPLAVYAKMGQQEEREDVVEKPVEKKPFPFYKHLALFGSIFLIVLLVMFFPSIKDGVMGFIGVDVQFRVYDNEMIPITGMVAVGDLRVPTNEMVKLKGRRNDMMLTVENFPIKGIEITGLKMEPEIKIRLDDISEGVVLGKRQIYKGFAIDPTGMDFKTAVVKGIAQGTALYKCPTWNFINATCKGKKWKKIQNLVVGHEYEIQISMDDPAFIEIDPKDVPTIEPKIEGLNKGSSNLITQVQLFDRSDNTQIEGEVRRGFYDAEVKLDDTQIQQIKFEKLALSTADQKILVDNLPKAKADNLGFVEAYAIDPSKLQFEKAEITITAVGANLHKCTEWDYENSVCKGEWSKLMDMIPGEVYTFNITPKDPGFGEGYANITLNVSSLAYTNKNLTIFATGFLAARNVSVNIEYGAFSVSGYPKTVVSDTDGNVTDTWEIPLLQAEGNYTISMIDLGSSMYNKTTTTIVRLNDTTPPATVTNLTNVSNTAGSIKWEWQNPSDPDFSHNVLKINNVWEVNTSATSYNATLLSRNTSYTLTVSTVDTHSNENSTVVNSTAKTWILSVIPPNVTTVGPANGTKDLDGNITFVTTVKANNSIVRCALLIDGTEDQNVTSVNTSASFNKTLSSGNYTWQVVCYDSASLSGSTVVNKLEVFTAAANFTQVINATYYNVQSNVTYEIDRIFKKNKELYELIGNWPPKVQDLGEAMSEYKEILENMSVWLDTYRTNEDRRHNDSDSIIGDILAWVGLNDEDEKHAKIVELIEGAAYWLNKTEVLTSATYNYIAASAEPTILMQTSIETILDDSINLTAAHAAMLDINEVKLETGLNVISLVKDPSNKAIATVLADIATNITKVDYYNPVSRTWQVYIPDAPFGNTLHYMDQGKRYLVFSEKNATIVIS